MERVVFYTFVLLVATGKQKLVFTLKVELEHIEAVTLTPSQDQLVLCR